MPTWNVSCWLIQSLHFQGDWIKALTISAVQLLAEFSDSSNTGNPSCPAPSCTDTICPLWPPQHPSLRYHPSSVSLISYSNCAALPCLPIGHNDIVSKSYSYHVTHFALKDFWRLFFPSLALSEGHKAGLSISTFHLCPSLLFSPSSAHLQLLVTFILMNITHFLQEGLWAQKVVSIPQGLPQNSPTENPLHPFFSLLSLSLEEHAWPTQDRLGCEKVSRWNDSSVNEMQQLGQAQP